MFKKLIAMTLLLCGMALGQVTAHTPTLERNNTWSGTETFNGVVTISAAPVFNVDVSLGTHALSAGAATFTSIGAVTPGTGAFTTLTSTGGGINGTVGASTPSSGVFTSLTSTSGGINGTVGATTPNTGAFTSLSASAPTFTGTDSGTETLKNKTLTSASSGNSTTLLNTQTVTTAFTGNATDQTIYTFTLPAGTLRAGTGIRITTSWAHSSGTGSVTYKVFFGASSSCVNATSTTTGQFFSTAVILNEPASTTTQRCSSLTISSSAVIQAVAGGAPAENTANAVVVKVTFNAAASEQVIGGQIVIELIQ